MFSPVTPVRLLVSWLRVFRRTNAAHLVHRGGQERSPRERPSEKYAACRGSVSDGRHMITACFTRALQSCTSCIGVHVLLTFQEVMQISKTCNQLARNQLLYKPPLSV